MSDLNQLYEQQVDLKKVLPSFFTVPCDTEAEREGMEKNNITAALSITSGEFQDHLVILREIEVLDNGQLSINYTSMDKDHKEVSCPALEEIIGNLVNYFLINEAIRTLESSEEE